MSLLLLFRGSVGGNNYTLPISAGGFVFSGQSANTLLGKKLVMGAGTFTLSGINAGTIAGRKLTADTRAFNLSGLNVGTLIGKRLIALGGSFAAVGVAILLRKGFTLKTNVGTFNLLTPNLNLFLQRILNGEKGTFTFNGLEIILQTQTFSPVANYRKVGIDAENRKVVLDNLLRVAETQTQNRTVQTFSVSRKINSILVDRLVRVK
jgi:hypothetical protein